MLGDAKYYGCAYIEYSGHETPIIGCSCKYRGNEHENAHHRSISHIEDLYFKAKCNAKKYSDLCGRKLNNIWRRGDKGIYFPYWFRKPGSGSIVWHRDDKKYCWNVRHNFKAIIMEPTEDGIMLAKYSNTATIWTRRKEIFEQALFAEISAHVAQPIDYTIGVELRINNRVYILRWEPFRSYDIYESERKLIIVSEPSAIHIVHIAD